jgi:hypothetical protein
MGSRVDSFTAVDVANLMVLTKVARAKTSPHKLDHYIDIAGYAICGHACVEKHKIDAEQGLADAAQELGWTEPFKGCIAVCTSCNTEFMLDNVHPHQVNRCIKCDGKLEVVSDGS